MIDGEAKLDPYFRAVWRAKWLILALVAGAAAVSAGVSTSRPALHSASGLLQVGRVWGQSLEDPYVTTEIANSAGFLNEVAAAGDLSPGYLRRSVKAETVTAGPPRSAYPILVRITATTESPADSVRIASAVAEGLVERHGKTFDQTLAPHLDRERRLEERYEDLAKQNKAAPLEALLKIEEELFEVRTRNSSLTETGRTQLVGEVVPGPVFRPPVVRNAIAAAIIAAAVGIVLAVIVGHFSTQPGRTPESAA